jgi:hypothetical protein
MLRCTWMGCQNCGEQQVAKDGTKWAVLCSEHLAELENAINPVFKPAKVVRAWVLAQGGAKEAAKLMRTSPLLE